MVSPGDVSKEVGREVETMTVSKMEGACVGLKVLEEPDNVGVEA